MMLQLSSIVLSAEPGGTAGPDVNGAAACSAQNAGQLRPHDLPEIANYDEWTSNTSVLVGGRRFRVARGDMAHLGVSGSSRFYVLPALVTREEVQSILALVNGSDAPVFDADPDSVDGMVSHEIFVDNDELRAGSLQPRPAANPVPGKDLDAREVAARRPLREKLNPNPNPDPNPNQVDGVMRCVGPIQARRAAPPILPTCYLTYLITALPTPCLLTLLLIHHPGPRVTYWMPLLTPTTRLPPAYALTTQALKSRYGQGYKVDLRMDQSAMAAMAATASGAPLPPSTAAGGASSLAPSAATPVERLLEFMRERCPEAVLEEVEPPSLTLTLTLTPTLTLTLSLTRSSPPASPSPCRRGHRRSRASSASSLRRRRGCT